MYKQGLKVKGIYLPLLIFVFHININMDKFDRNEPESGQRKATEDNWWRPAFLMFSRFFGWIIFPPLVGSVIGMWLDKKYGTDPWLFIGSVGVTFIFSITGLVKNALREFKKIEELNKKDDRK